MTDILLLGCFLFFSGALFWTARELYRNLKEENRELKERIRKYDEAPLTMPYRLRRQVEDISANFAVYRLHRDEMDMLLETLSNQLAELHTPNHRTAKAKIDQ